MSQTLFSPLAIQPLYNASRQSQPETWHPEFDEALATLPSGEQRYWGIPFELSPADPQVGEGDGKADTQTPPPSLLLLGSVAGTASSATIPIPPDPQGRTPSHLVFLHLCGTPAAAAEQSTAQGMIPLSVSRLGQRLADYTLIYTDGTEQRQPIRCRFEVNGGRTIWGQRAFAARREQMDTPLNYRGSYERDAWGRAQTSVQSSHGAYWLYALPNPHPDRLLSAVRLDAATDTQNTHGADSVANAASSGDVVIAIAAVTAFFGTDHPLRHRRLQSFRVEVPAELARELQAPGLDSASIPTTIDLGVIARAYAVPAFDPDAWLAGEGVRGEAGGAAPVSPGQAARPPALTLDITASADATLRVGEHDVPLRAAYEQGAASSSGGAVRVELLTPQRTWMHVAVQDPTTGKPTPSRIHFRSPDGRYLPPYGYRQEVNANWFEDYGADLRHLGTQYAYVDGTFQMEMPVGDVYVEIFRGFEHQPLRQKLSIRPGQRALQLSPQRPLDWRSR
ncbi:MAG TPA: hypothetical protein VNM48_19265, partial [Chloroflexota bacterium]|nr:hypothetical protein [Chloroflexota bacterium]